ncbi:MAG TPA: TonB-dependent receptor plug domain-containing protein [Bacteroidales bacterium]|nr:TonB-dependent receptor plug domain-containing protein [Bacteroidales bacterium]HQG62329.1 TonB-dependent receptor plug domain-containing protein [Bacteroidales bacterium]
MFLLIIAASVDLSGQKAGKKITVSGIVVDMNNQPVPEVIIMIDGKTTNVRTDRDGYYKIKVKPSTVSIGIFPYAGRISEQALNNRTQVNFMLESLVSQSPGYNENSPGEEVINIGYGSARSKNMASKVSKISGSDKANANYTDIYEMIKGQVPNVEVHGKSIRIQGASSFIEASTEPLLIVDGIIVNTIEGIPPQSVRSIEILKGADAAIYGSRGANGVVMVTLKSAGDR